MAEEKSKTYLAELAEVLQAWPLYRKFSFNGLKCFVLPFRLRLYCQICGGERNWQEPQPIADFRVTKAPPPPPRVGQNSPLPPTTLGGYGQKTYTCRDCDKASVTYFYYYFWKLDGDSLFFKVGQH